MLKKRIITTLLFNKNFECVKPISFQRPYRKLGNMTQYLNTVERRNIDELILIDIEASEFGYKPQFDKIKKFTNGLFCPLTVGGGINSLDDITKLLANGADKVAIKTKFELLYDAARKFGSQAIVGVIDYNKSRNLIELITYVRLMENQGVGEILLTSILKDGTLNGYDLITTEAIARSINIPTIANGGCYDALCMKHAFDCGADAAAAGSMFLYTDITPRICAEELFKMGIETRVEL